MYFSFFLQSVNLCLVLFFIFFILNFQIDRRERLTYVCFCCRVSDFNIFSKDSLVVVAEILTYNSSTHLVISFLCNVLCYRCSSVGISAYS